MAKKLMITPVLLALAVWAPASSHAAQPGGEQPAVDWIKGPGKVSIEKFAEVDLPKGYVFAGKKGTIAVMKMMGNLVTGQEAGFIAPEKIFDKDSKQNWFVVFEFNPVGYVKDDEKNSIDSAKLLESMKEGTKQGNKERTKMGFPTLEVVGWAVEPHYDEKTHNLEWGLKLKAETGGEVVNYEVRLLGRNGVMQSTLVLGPDQLKRTLPEFRSLLGTYSFIKGQRYAEYKPGDKIAKFGLLALIGGGAIAVAAKTGLLKYVWKYIIFIVMAVVMFVKKIWDKFFGKRESVD